MRPVGRTRFHLLPSATSLGKGHVFTNVCQEFCPRGVYPSMHWGRHPQADTHNPLGRHPPWVNTPWAHTHLGTPPPVHAGIHTSLPPGGHCSGWYASYWDAFLLFQKKHLSVEYEITLIFANSMFRRTAKFYSHSRF